MPNYNLNIESYELKDSRSGHKVAVINGLHLHSSYDPIREAEVFIEKHQSTLESKNQILLLGMGLGYHLSKLNRELSSLYGDDYKIVVIEPIEKLFKDAKRYGQVPSSKNIYYYTTSDIEKLYAQNELLDFLVKKPGVIIHTGSLNLNRDFFESFLSQRAKQTNTAAKQCPIHPQLVQYLQSFGPEDEEIQMNELYEMARTKKNLESLDHLILTIQGLKMRSQQERSL